MHAVGGSVLSLFSNICILTLHMSDLSQTGIRLWRVTQPFILYYYQYKFLYESRLFSSPVFWMTIFSMKVRNYEST